MAELVKYIACCLVDHPDLVEVREVPGDQALILELRVAPEDMARSSASRAASPRRFAPWSRPQA